MKILAAVVTYNRCDLLKRCINHLEQQTTVPDEILVVDNGSSDDTIDFLKKKKINYIAQDNLGSAGGWYKSIEYSIEKNFDYVWLMDDDGYPEKKALNKLINNFKKEYSCISSIVIDENNHSKLVFPMPLKINNKYMKYEFPFFKIRNYKFFIQNNITHYSFCHLFNGALLRVSDLQNIGNINKDYFLYGDEVDYYFRLINIGKLMTLVNCIHYHPTRSNANISTTWVFYALKNTIINNFKYRKFPNFFNFIAIILFPVRILFRNGFKELISYIFGNNSKFYYKAIKLGYTKSIGKNKPS